MKLGKKLLSLLTLFCLTLSLLPTMALATDDGEGSTGSPATSVSVGSVSLNSSTPYLVKNKTTAQQTITPEEQSQGYIQFTSNGQITLNNYSGTSGISATGDLTIDLVGTNTITGGSNLIKTSTNSSVPTANLTIKSSAGGSLTVNNTGSSSVNTIIYSNSNITITGNATLTATINGSAQAIHAASANGKITIAENATVTATNANNTTTSEYGIAILAGNSTSNSNGTIEVKDSATLTAKGHGKALACQTFTATGYTVKASTDYNTTNPGEYVAANLATYKYITATPSAPTYTVSGTVMDASGRAINGATVQLCTADTVGSSDPTVISYSTTESNGTYTLSNVPANSDNDYAIKVTKEGYTVLTTENFSVSSNVSNKNLTLTAIPPSQYAVTISGQNMTVTSGDVSQTVNVGSEISDVVFAAAEGYYFPDNYVSSCLDLSGLAVTRDNYTQITVSGKPNASATITLPSLTEKEEQTAPDFLLAFDCTGIDKNDGRITEMKPTMEYQKESDSASNTWTTVPYSDYGIINNLEPGTYLVRYKETATKKASDSVRITIKVTSEYGVWVCGIPVTSQNKGNVFGNTGAPTATYDSQTGTLTLNNASIDNTATSVLSMGSTKRNTDTAGIFTTGNLTIHVTGNSSIKSTYGNAIKGNGNLTISGTASLTLNSLEDMNSLSLDYYSSTLIIKDTVNITAIVGLSRPLGSGDVYTGISVSAYTTTIQDSANVTAINNGRGWALYSPNNITVKDSAILTAQSEQEGNATSAITYPGHTVTASTTFDGPSSGGSTEPYNPAKLNTYKYVKVEPITVTGVELNKDSLSIKVGQSETLTATLQPSGAVQDVTWTSSDDKIVTVTNGTVTAVGVGTATITVTTTNGGQTYTDTCTVTVTNASSSSGSHTTYYPVNTPAKSEGGSVAVSQKSASKGSAVTVTVTPESGYQVSSVQAVDKDGKKLTLTDKGDGKYSFVMPASKVDVTARFAQVQQPEEKDPYSDVSKDSYYYDAVKWAAETGVTTGVGDGLFAPEWVCTRGQIVTFLWRASGSPAPKATEMPFTDVAADAYYAQAVLWAVENGITNGTSETTFSPDQTCTRAHAVAFLYRMSGSPAAAGSTFTDVAADAYYSAAVAWAVEKGITNGTSGTTFSPDDTCTRGQIVTFLYRLEQAK